LQDRRCALVQGALALPQLYDSERCRQGRFPPCLSVPPRFSRSGQPGFTRRNPHCRNFHWGEKEKKWHAAFRPPAL